VVHNRWSLPAQLSAQPRYGRRPRCRSGVRSGPSGAAGQQPGQRPDRHRDPALDPAAPRHWTPQLRDSARSSAMAAAFSPNWDTLQRPGSAPSPPVGSVASRVGVCGPLSTAPIPRTTYLLGSRSGHRTRRVHGWRLIIAPGEGRGPDARPPCQASGWGPISRRRTRCMHGLPDLATVQASGWGPRPRQPCQVRVRDPRSAHRARRMDGARTTPLPPARGPALGWVNLGRRGGVG
jgi:hypothetical protein